MGNRERELLVSRYEMISNIASYNGLLLGVAHTGWKAHVNQVEAILKEIEAAYVRTYSNNGRLINVLIGMRVEYVVIRKMVIQLILHDIVKSRN